MKYKYFKTCNRFPEQYDVYDGNKLIAYVRLRHGMLSCYEQSKDQKLGAHIFSIQMSDDFGEFISEEQREMWLNRIDIRLMNYFQPKSKIVPYYNEDHTKYAVLISYGYGIGWSTDNGDIRLAYDSRIIEWYLSLSNEQLENMYYPSEITQTRNFLTSLGYNIDHWNFLGLKPGMIRWVDVGKVWRLHEYDGAESIEYLNEDDWVCFNG